MPLVWLSIEQQQFYLVLFWKICECLNPRTLFYLPGFINISPLARNGLAWNLCNLLLPSFCNFRDALILEEMMFGIGCLLLMFMSLVHKIEIRCLGNLRILKAHLQHLHWCFSFIKILGLGLLSLSTARNDISINDQALILLSII